MNFEKHPKETMQQMEQPGPSVASAHAPHLMRQHLPGVEDGGASFILRLEDLQANPENLERMRERVRHLNRRLAQSGAPFRLRLV